MKIVFKSMLVLLILFAISSCKKDSEELKNESFTECPPNTSFSYLFIDNADLEGDKVITGSSRVFQAKFKNYYSTASFRFTAKPNANNFYISSESIHAGAVKYSFACPACNFFIIRPVGGYIKGSRVEKNKWLIDAVIFMDHLDNNYLISGKKPLDTIKLKQYFYPSLNNEILIK